MLKHLVISNQRRHTWTIVDVFHNEATKVVIQSLIIKMKLK